METGVEQIKAQDKEDTNYMPNCGKQSERSIDMQNITCSIGGGHPKRTDMVGNNAKHIGIVIDPNLQNNYNLIQKKKYTASHRNQSLTD